MILFDHLPKTGGTTVTEALANLCGVPYAMDGTHRNHSAEIRRKNRKPFLSGHFWFTIGDRLDPQTYYTTVLRDPIDRFLSQYYFSRNDSESQGDTAAIAAKRLDLDEYVSSSERTLVNSYSNVQARHFAALTLSLDISQVTDKILYQAALDALQQYDLVGVYEDLHGFIDVFCADWGFVPPESLPFRNITSQRLRSDEISSSTLAKLKAANEVDRELYAWARAAFLTRYRKTIVSIFNSKSANLVDYGDSVALDNKFKEQVAEKDNEFISQLLLNFGTRDIEITEVRCIGKFSGGPVVNAGEQLTIRICYLAHIITDDMTVGIAIRDLEGMLIFGTNSGLLGIPLSVKRLGAAALSYIFTANLYIGEYTVTVAIHKGLSHHEEICYHWLDHAARFQVVENPHGAGKFEGLVNLEPSIEVGCGNILPESCMKLSANEHTLWRAAPLLASSVAVKKCNLTNWVNPLSGNLCLPTPSIEPVFMRVCGYKNFKPLVTY